MADLTSVRTLIPSVSKLAKHLALSCGAIYRWIEVNRIPGNKLVKVANFYDVELRDLLHLTGSEKSNRVGLKLKPRGTLEVLVAVINGEKTLEEAAEESGQSEHSLRMILTLRGEQIPLLYETLEALDKKETSLDQACLVLGGLSKSTIHALRRQYGYAPGHPSPRKPSNRVNLRRAKITQAVLDCIAGKTTVKAAAADIDVSERTLFRAIDEVYPDKIQSLTSWPLAFREALASEIRTGGQSYVAKWLEIAKAKRLFMSRSFVKEKDGVFYLEKSPKFPETPSTWRDLPLKRLLIGALLGEATIEEIAASRGGDPEVFKTLFNGDLTEFGVTFDELIGLSFSHQVVMADILRASMDRRRKW
jgi:hypothetical protein